MKKSNKIINRKALWLISLMLMMFTIPSIMAVEWDNIKSYDSIKNEITFTNTVAGIPFLPLGDIAKATLDTPQINYVIPGKDRLVAQITIDSYTDYTTFLKGMELIDLKTGKQIDREITYKYAEEYEVDVSNYKERCFLTIDKGKEVEACVPEPDGTTHKEIRYRWISLSKLDLKVEKLTIGIFTDVLKGDNVEWIPTLFGIKVIEWAVWSDSLDNGLVAYYNFTQNPPKENTTLANVKTGLFNMTIVGGDINWTTGKIGGGFDFDGTATVMTNITTSNQLHNSTNMTWVVWVYPHQCGFGATYNSIMADQSGNLDLRFIGSSCKISFDTQNGGDLSAVTDLKTNAWNMVAITYGGGTKRLYINGTEESNELGNWFVADISPYHTRIGKGGNGYFDGIIDEIGIWNRTLSLSEISDLYNGGTGLTYIANSSSTSTPSFNVTQSYPANGLTTISTSIPIGCNFSSLNQNISSTLLNVTNSLGVQAYSNTTTYSGLSSINQSWITSTLTTDTYNWTCSGYGNQGVNDTSGIRSFTIVSFLENSRTFNSSTYQTAYEGYGINLNGTISSVTLIYNGTSYTATQSGSNWYNNILIPSNANGNTSLYWNVSYVGGSSLTSSSYQYRYPIDFKLCNATTNSTYGYGSYLNITFRDELTLTTINGTLSPLEVTYYLYNSTSYKTLSYTNTSINNPVHSFCFNPRSPDVYASMTGSSSMTGYPVRNWANESWLTNTTNIETIDLLATGDGVYQTVVVTNSAGTALVGATVSASTPILGIVDTRTTDAAGGVSLWLDPNKAHTLTTSLTGYPTDIRTINPSPTTTVYVTLGGTTTYNSSLSYSLTEGITATFEPVNNTLFNGTSYDFKFILSSTIWTVTEYGFSIYNSSGAIVNSTSALTNGGTLTLNYNVINNTRMDAKGYYIINGSIRYASDSWNVMNSADTQYSILFLRNRIVAYIDSGFFGLKHGTGLNIFCFLIIFITIGVFSWKYSINEPIIIAIATLFMVWLFEFGLGLIEITGIPMTVWVGIIILGLLIKEGLKVI